MTKGIFYTNLKKEISPQSRECMSEIEYQRQAYEISITNKVFADLHNPKVKKLIKESEAEWERVKQTPNYKKEEEEAGKEAEKARQERQMKCLPFFILKKKLSDTFQF